MQLNERLQLEKEWHEAEDLRRGHNRMISGVYDSGVFEQAERFHIDALGEPAGAHVLDYGCGAGWSTRLLRARGAVVTAFDISLTRLDEAHAHLANQLEVAPSLLQCAAEELPFASAHFDAVFGKQVLHHLDLDVAISEIVRVLRPGGKAVFLEPLRHNPLLEGYRRATPGLRSPTERALSMEDVARIGSHFRSYRHREFVLFSVLPALAEVMVGPSPWLDQSRVGLEGLDRKLVDTFPPIGRYCWETVLILER